MKADLWPLYKQMYKSRLFEEAVIKLWEEGIISGEMHLGIGEEGIMAGIVDHLIDGDALALDHRGTSPMIMRGVDPVSLLKELLGRPDGLCGGRGGHMHLFSREHRIASSGIVGASGPAAAGFALASQYWKKGNIAVAFFGEGAMNQGMLMESMNLTAAWNLPVVFICKDNNMSITTVSSTVTGGNLAARARAFGLIDYAVDGGEVEEVWAVAGKAIQSTRRGDGPSFIHATCFHVEGHFLGDPLLRIARKPVKEMKEMGGPLMKSAAKVTGASMIKRAGSIASIIAILGKTIKNELLSQKDPLVAARSKLEKEKKRLQELEDEVRDEITRIVTVCLE
jgi:acetoin:2,6-dichlorophenolindophenol oxidoreductase subunit alpha